MEEEGVRLIQHIVQSLVYFCRHRWGPRQGFGAKPSYGKLMETRSDAKLLEKTSVNKVMPLVYENLRELRTGRFTRVAPKRGYDFPDD